MPPHPAEGWGLGFSPSHTRVGSVGLPLPVPQDPGLLCPRGVVLGHLSGLRQPPQLAEPIAAAPAQHQGAQPCSLASRRKAACALPEREASGRFGKQITSGNDSVGSFGFTWFLLPPPQSPASTCALEEALELICAIMQGKPRKG